MVCVYENLRIGCRLENNLSLSNYHSIGRSCLYNLIRLAYSRARGVPLRTLTALWAHLRRSAAAAADPAVMEAYCRVVTASGDVIVMERVSGWPSLSLSKNISPGRARQQVEPIGLWGTPSHGEVAPHV
jgi:hypothetical protein